MKTLFALLLGVALGVIGTVVAVKVNPKVQESVIGVHKHCACTACKCEDCKCPDCVCPPGACKKSEKPAACNDQNPSKECGTKGCCQGK